MEIFKISFLSLFLMTSISSAEQKLPFQVKEPMTFMSVKVDPLMTLGKKESYVGSLLREDGSGPVENQIDLYEYSIKSYPQVTAELCQKLAADIFGPPGEISFDVKKAEVRPSKSKGHICSIALIDKSPQSRVKERHLLVTQVKLRVMAFVFRYEKTPSATQRQGAYDFLEALR